MDSVPKIAGKVFFALFFLSLALGQVSAISSVSISGYKFNDLDGNGEWGEEPGIDGWTIYLDTNNNSVLDDGEPSTTTGEGGYYSFSGIAPGNYTIREVQQGGWAQTAPEGGNHGITLANDSGSANNNFGNFQQVAISGQKFNDLNRDGVKDGEEPGLAGWEITLAYGDEQTIAATTDENGSYAFSNLGPGTYTAAEVQQFSWVQTTENQGPISVSSGNNVSDVDFGNFDTSVISGKKFEDLNGNGVEDEGEAGLPGWTINLYSGGDQEEPIQSATTGEDGSYQFSDIEPGTYAVREVQQDGWLQTTADPGPVELAQGADATAGFGNFHLISISGYKFNDLDGNGEWGEGEIGLPGWTIYLNGDENSAVTDEGGYYSFSGIGPGTHVLSEQGQEGWLQTTAGPGPIAAVSGNDVGSVDFGNKEGAILKVTKQVTNDNGGTRQASDFQLFVARQPWCYQETATQPTLCGGLDTGAYDFTGEWNDNSLNANDGDWGTFGKPVEFSSAELGITYAKPVGALPSSIWQVKDGAGTENLTIPEGCWNADLSSITFKVTSDDEMPDSAWSCQNGDGWTEMRHTSGSEANPNPQDIYEEAMWWNYDSVPTGVASGNRTNFTTGIYTVSEISDSGYAATFSENCAEGQIALVFGEDRACTMTNDDIYSPPPPAPLTGGTAGSNNGGGNVFIPSSPPPQSPSPEETATPPALQTSAPPTQPGAQPQQAARPALVPAVPARAPLQIPQVAAEEELIAPTAAALSWSGMPWLLLCPLALLIAAIILVLLWKIRKKK